MTGRWQWGSGTQHCAWILGGTVCDDGAFRLCWFDAADVTFHDTWYTSGLRGTGSLDFSVDGAVVPLARTIQPLTSRPTVDVPLAWFPNFSLLAAGVASVGAGHRAAGDRRARGVGRGQATPVLVEDTGPEPVHADRAGAGRGRAALGPGVPPRRGRPGLAHGVRR